jgi:hypothetical protein
VTTGYFVAFGTSAGLHAVRNAPTQREIAGEQVCVVGKRKVCFRRSCLNLSQGANMRRLTAMALFFPAVMLLACVIVSRAAGQSPTSGRPPVAIRGSEAVQLPEVPTEVRYYAIIFAYQDAWALPQKCHTWATFVKLSLEDRPGAPPVVEQHSISWLPGNFASTNHLTILPSVGKNHSLQETMCFAARQCLPVCHWGPYEIDECLYARARNQVDYLNSGCVRYMLLEPIRHIQAYSRTGGALHCTHAVTDLSGFVVTGFTRGYAAGQLTVDLFSNHIRRSAPKWLYDMVLNARQPDSLPEGAAYVLPR